MFCEIIPLYGATGSPVDQEVFLCDTILYPEESHVHGFRFLLPDGRVDDARRRRVVCLEWCARLRVSHLGQACSDRFRDLSIVEEGSEFCLRGGRHNVAKCLALGVKDSVGGRFARRDVRVALVAQRVVSPGAASSVLDGEVGCVAFDYEAHSAGVIPNGGVRVRGGIVE